MNQQVLESKLKPTTATKPARATSADTGRLNAGQRNIVRMMLATARAKYYARTVAVSHLEMAEHSP